MQDDLAALLSMRRGHFRLESGYHAEIWLDLDTLFVQPRRLRPFVQELAARLAPHRLEAVCGPLSGGAYVAQMIALELDLEFFHAARTVAPSPDALYSARYTVPGALRGRLNGKRTAIVDDVINAGSAARATYADLVACGARPVALGALLLLGSAARALAASAHMALESVAQMPSPLWAPADCPLCAINVPLEDPEAA